MPDVALDQSMLWLSLTMKAFVILWACVALAIATIGNGIALVWKTDALEEAELSLQEAATVSRLSNNRDKEGNTCDGFDGIMWVSRVIRKAGAGTMFFQSIVDSLIYAEKYNLRPWIWINDDENKPCYDPKVHGAGPNTTYSHLTGVIKELVGEGKMACKTKHGTRPGPPDYLHLEMADHTVIGNGM